MPSRKEPPISMLVQDLLTYLLLCVFHHDRYTTAGADTRTCLMLVCSSWMATVLRTADFWCAVPITLLHKPSALVDILHHASAAPLSVYLRATRTYVADRQLGYPSRYWNHPEHVYIQDSLAVLADHYRLAPSSARRDRDTHSLKDA